MKKIVLISLILALMLAFSSCGGNETPESTPTPTPVPSPTPVVEIADDVFYTNMTSSNSRPVAVMIDNDVKARPQSGLENAYAVYEMMVEGASTRLMAMFKDCTATKVGPVRSSRHYFLDYSEEHDAIYAHCGYSPQAQSDLSALGIANVNELTSNNGKNYYRDTSRKAPHNLYTSLPELISSASGKGYSVTTDVGNVFSYNKNDADLISGTTAEKITIPYITGYTVSYEYDKENKLYKRFINSAPHTTATDGSALMAKNIIVYQVKNYTIDNYGRQNLNTVSSGSGYYITNGKAISITWQKNSRTGKTSYMTENGADLVINPGNVYVQIIPQTSNITIE